MDLVSAFVSKASSEGTEPCCRKSFLSKTEGKRVGFWSCPLLWLCKEMSIKLQGMLKCWAKLQFSLFGYKWISRYTQTHCYVNVGTGRPLTARLCWLNCHGLLMSSGIINSHIWYKETRSLLCSLTFSCDGHHLFTANSDGNVIAWCRKDQQRLKLPMFYSFLSSYAAGWQQGLLLTRVSDAL